ncbi:GIY-YIG nuclease family protein [Sphingomonas sp. HITSZ_GF]|uniref:GIY-YIG nuclease family protein n=1 Tax=Sphingomonas sp. HITSZ_GF TaxID=3037247 RepID=UPI00240DFD96|nr:GIY-YIG nuclease family protein [Sphingomonas sp. HITSZ_GF]MDG2532747.1 GIY-YIG nuclease family protein [Sphingomonas sp. HITSZ_GF]
MAGYTYIIANRKNGALYTGVTAEMSRRALDHREGAGSKFAARYGIYRLVYVEFHDEIDNAILREKRITKWRRAWKIALIEESNPDWRDLFFDLNC